jgi:hypothetical protein
MESGDLAVDLNQTPPPHDRGELPELRVRLPAARLMHAKRYEEHWSPRRPAVCSQRFFAIFEQSSRPLPANQSSWRKLQRLLKIHRILGQPHLAGSDEEKFFLRALFARKWNQLCDGKVTISYHDFLPTFGKCQIFTESVLELRNIYTSHK